MSFASPTGLAILESGPSVIAPCEFEDPIGALNPFYAQPFAEMSSSSPEILYELLNR
jgi:hypothetical protein